MKLQTWIMVSFNLIMIAISAIIHLSPKSFAFFLTYVFLWTPIYYWAVFRFQREIKKVATNKAFHDLSKRLLFNPWYMAYHDHIRESLEVRNILLQFRTFFSITLVFIFIVVMLPRFFIF